MVSKRLLLLIAVVSLVVAGCGRRASDPPEAVLRKAVEMHDSGYSEDAKAYMTDKGKGAVVMGRFNFDGVFGAWDYVKKSTTDTYNGKPMKIELGYDKVIVNGQQARVPVMERFEDGSTIPFHWSDGGGLTFVLVNRDGTWLVDAVE